MPTNNRNWSVAAGVLAVCIVGAIVGTKAGNLAHRAPRGSGTRVAVLAPHSDIARDAVVRDLLAIAGVSVIPPSVLSSKRKQMVRGGIDDASEEDAAEVLDADVVVRVSEGDAEAARAVENARVVLVAHGEKHAAGRGVALITDDIGAYRAFLEGERLTHVGDWVGASSRYHAALARDPAFAEAWAALAYASFFRAERNPQLVATAKHATQQARTYAAHLRPVNALVVEAISAWIAHDEAAPELRAALREPAIAACRTLTVKFPEEPRGHLMLGRAYRDLFQGATEGLRHLESARRLTPDSYVITEQLVAAWLSIGDRKHAAQALRGFLAGLGDANPNAPGYQEAKVLVRSLDTPNAIVPRARANPE